MQEKFSEKIGEKEKGEKRENGIKIAKISYGTRSLTDCMDSVIRLYIKK